MSARSLVLGGLLFAAGACAGTAGAIAGTVATANALRARATAPVGAPAAIAPVAMTPAPAPARAPGARRAAPPAPMAFPAALDAPPATAASSASAAAVWDAIAGVFRPTTGDNAPVAAPAGLTWHDFMSKDDLTDVLETVYQKGYAAMPVDYADPVLNQRKVFLTTDLDEMQAQALIAKLTYLDGKSPGTPIDLFIYTNGGYGGYLVADYLHRLQSPVNTWCLDNCCSAGAILLAAGTGKRRASPSACVTVHIVMRESDPNDKSENPDHRAKDQDRNQLRRFWSAHSTLPAELYDLDHEQFYYFTADEALKYGIIDEIVDQPKK